MPRVALAGPVHPVDEDRALHQQQRDHEHDEPHPDPPVPRPFHHRARRALKARATSSAAPDVSPQRSLRANCWESVATDATPRVTASSARVWASRCPHWAVASPTQARAYGALARSVRWHATCCESASHAANSSRPRATCAAAVQPSADPQSPGKPASTDVLAEKAAGTRSWRRLPVQWHQGRRIRPCRGDRAAGGAVGHAARSDRRREHGHRIERLGEDRQRQPADRRRTRPSRPLDRVRVDSTDRALTTNQGVPVGDNQSSLKAGLRGPTLLEDFILREKITHFDHERIPERIVHARGSAAHGFFECYKPLHGVHPRLAVRRGRQADAGVRALLDGARRARLDRHGARRPRLRRQVLHRRGQLGPGRQQHPGLLHPGRDEVPRPRPRGQAGAALRDAAGRHRRTTRSGTSRR